MDGAGCGGWKWFKGHFSEKKSTHLPHRCFGKGRLCPLTSLAPWRAQSAPADRAPSSGRWWSTEPLHLHSPCPGYPGQTPCRVTAHQQVSWKHEDSRKLLNRRQKTCFNSGSNIQKTNHKGNLLVATVLWKLRDMDMSRPAGERMSSEIVFMHPELTASSVTVTNLPACPALRENRGLLLHLHVTATPNDFYREINWKVINFRKWMIVWNNVMLPQLICINLLIKSVPNC